MVKCYKIMQSNCTHWSKKELRVVIIPNFIKQHIFYLNLFFTIFFKDKGPLFSEISVCFKQICSLVRSLPAATTPMAGIANQSASTPSSL